MTNPFKSAIYYGRVWHCRHQPRQHEFNYNVYMVYLDLDELDSVFSQSRWWGKKNSQENSRPSGLWPLVQFRRRDFFRNFDKPLPEAVRDWVAVKTGERPVGPIRMLANLRCFGFLINPIVCYYVFDDKGEHVKYVIGEVTSTPWGERIQYLVPAGPDGAVDQHEFSKQMHVSPFHGMNMHYQWSSSAPGQALQLNINNLEQGTCVFQAQLQLQRVAMTAKTQAKAVKQFPLMTLKVASAIYWQALKLFVKGVPVRPHPKSIVRNG